MKIPIKDNVDLDNATEIPIRIENDPEKVRLYMNPNAQIVSCDMCNADMDLNRMKSNPLGADGRRTFLCPKCEMDIKRIHDKRFQRIEKLLYFRSWAMYLRTKTGDIRYLRMIIDTSKRLNAEGYWVSDLTYRWKGEP